MSEQPQNKSFLSNRPQIERFYLKNLLFHKTQSFTVPFLDQDNLDNSAPFLEPKEEELNNLDSDSSLFSQKDEFHQAQNFEQDIEDYEEKTKEIEKLINNLDEHEKAKFDSVFKPKPKIQVTKLKPIKNPLMKKKDSLNDKKQYPSNNQNIYKNMKNDVKSKNNINNLYSDSNANKNDIHKKGLVMNDNVKKVNKTLENIPERKKKDSFRINNSPQTAKFNFDMRNNIGKSKKTAFK